VNKPSTFRSRYGGAEALLFLLTSLVGCDQYALDSNDAASLSSNGDTGAEADALIPLRVDVVYIARPVDSDGEEIAIDDQSFLINAPPWSDRTLELQPTILSLIHISEPTRPY